MTGSCREQRLERVGVDPLPGHDGGSPMELASAFVLRRDGDGLRVVVYINHHDIAAALGARVSRG